MYVSIDIETLGLNPDYCDFIEFGAVIDDMKSPVEQLHRFHAYILPPTQRYFYQGEPHAMAMHPEILKRIANKEAPYEYLRPHELGPRFRDWLGCRGYELNEWGKVSVVAAGKNFQGFDMRFLRRAEGFTKAISVKQRVHDPAVLYFDPKTDDAPPGLDVCLKRAGIDKSVENTAVADAIDVIRCLRHKWGVL